MKEDTSALFCTADKKFPFQNKSRCFPAYFPSGKGKEGQNFAPKREAFRAAKRDHAPTLPPRPNKKDAALPWNAKGCF
jgi:hypothetical protein